jgi:hypothetical protein
MTCLVHNANIGSAAHSVSSNKMYRQLSPRDEFAGTWKRQLISACSKFKNMWTSNSTPSYAFTGWYVRPHHYIFQEYYLTEAQLFITYYRGHIKLYRQMVRVSLPTPHVRTSTMLLLPGIENMPVRRHIFSTVNTRQVLWIQVHWFKSWNVRTRVIHGELKGRFRFLDGKRGWKHCLYFCLVAVDNYPSKFPTHFPGWSAQDFVWTRQMYRFSIN